MSAFKIVYSVVSKIPEGNVATYGQIAEKVNSLSSGRKISPQLVGFALHANKDSKVPCHRVVDRNGRLAPNFAFTGWREQKLRLKAEGVGFKDKMHVDLERHIWQPK
jgi:methylated-DNA-protein-cysteine methyltransferase-like protein